MESTLPSELRTPEQALIRVSLLLGGLIIGQGQNESGNEAVILVKELLFRALRQRFPVEVRLGPGGGWNLSQDPSEIVNAIEIRFDRRLICDFKSGGNRPDIIMSLDDEVIAVGEIKARKDLSNVWESWMPQVAGHMKTWSAAYPNAARLFFGTVITEEMIAGVSRLGTQHTGLRELTQDGLLTTAYNLSEFVDLESNASSGLQNFVYAVCNTLK